MMETLKVRLNERGIHVGLSSAKMTQTERATVLREFKCNKHFLMMISSNSLARGVSFKASLVINFNVPPQHTLYYFRSTRVGRFGEAGQVISLVHPTERSSVEKFQSKFGVEIKLVD